MWVSSCLRLAKIMSKFYKRYLKINSHKQEVEANNMFSKVMVKETLSLISELSISLDFSQTFTRLLHIYSKLTYLF